MYSNRLILETTTARRMGAVVALFLLLSCAAESSATQITGARWNGPDFIVELSDSAAYKVDIGESDSMQLVAQIAATADNDVIDRRLRGPRGAEAVLVPMPDGHTRLTIVFRQPGGYATVWRPYTHRLVTHTFDWNAIPFHEKRYYEGLLALEEGVTDDAERRLAEAYATGEERAGSVLGVYYARQGKDSLAARYLRAPLDEDDRLALAELEGSAPEHTVERNRKRQIQHRNHRAIIDSLLESPQPSNSEQFLIALSDWRTLASIAVALLTFITVFIVLRRRNANAAAQRASEAESRAAHNTAYTILKTPVRSEPTDAPPPIAKSQQDAAAPQAEPPQTPIPQAVPIQTIEQTVALPSVETMPTPEPRPASPTLAEAPIAPAPSTTERTPETNRSDILAPPPSQSAPSRAISTQAAELQRRIEAARATGAKPVDDESTVSEARRLNVSRDNIELRRRMNDLRAKLDQPSDTWDNP